MALKWNEIKVLDIDLNQIFRSVRQTLNLISNSAAALSKLSQLCKTYNSTQTHTHNHKRVCEHTHTPKLRTIHTWPRTEGLGSTHPPTPSTPHPHPHPHHDNVQDDPLFSGFGDLTSTVQQFRVLGESSVGSRNPPNIY